SRGLAIRDPGTGHLACYGTAAALAAGLWRQCAGAGARRLASRDGGTGSENGLPVRGTGYGVRRVHSDEQPDCMIVRRYICNNIITCVNLSARKFLWKSIKEGRAVAPAACLWVFFA